MAALAIFFAPSCSPRRIHARAHSPLPPPHTRPTPPPICPPNRRTLIITIIRRVHFLPLSFHSINNHHYISADPVNSFRLSQRFYMIGWSGYRKAVT